MATVLLDPRTVMPSSLCLSRVCWYHSCIDADSKVGITVTWRCRGREGFIRSCSCFISCLFGRACGHRFGFAISAKYPEYIGVRCWALGWFPYTNSLVELHASGSEWLWVLYASCCIRKLILTMQEKKPQMFIAVNAHSAQLHPNLYWSYTYVTVWS